jgi:protein phosphatase
MDASPPARRVTVPPDALVLLVGASGSGKTTLARRCFDPRDVLSSDAFRALVSGDETDQRATPRAFRLLHLAADGRLRHGRLTVVDATNVLPASRRRLLRAAARHGRPAVAIVLALPEETCQAWNARRPGRSIAPEVVRRQHGLMRRALAHLGTEGFESIVALTSPDELSRVEIATERGSATLGHT